MGKVQEPELVRLFDDTPPHMHGHMWWVLEKLPAKRAKTM